MSQVPRVGCGCVVRRGEEILLIRRSGSHGHGTWSTPGGFLDASEDPATCAVREVREETGIRVGEPRLLGVTNDVFEEESRHSVTLWFEARYVGGELSPSDEVAEAGWFRQDALPGPTFLSFRNFLQGRLVR